MPQDWGMRAMQRAGLEGTRMETLRGEPGTSKPPSLSTEGEDLQDLQEKPFEGAWSGVWGMDQKEKTSSVLYEGSSSRHSSNRSLVVYWTLVHHQVLWFPTSSLSYSSPHPCLIFSCLLLFFLPSIPTHNLINHMLTDCSLDRQWAKHSCQSNPGAKPTSSFERTTRKGAKAPALPSSCTVREGNLVCPSHMMG